MDTLRLDSLIVALQENTAEISAVNEALLFSCGCFLGAVAVGFLLWVWLR